MSEKQKKKNVIVSFINCLNVNDAKSSFFFFLRPSAKNKRQNVNHFHISIGIKAGATLEKLVAQCLKAANIHFACQIIKKNGKKWNVASQCLRKNP